LRSTRHGAGPDGFAELDEVALGIYDVAYRYPAELRLQIVYLSTKVRDPTSDTV